MSNVYVLGSGFSANCGLPTSKDIFTEIMKFENREEDIRNVLAGIKIFYLHFKANSPIYPPFEEFLSLLYASIDFQDDVDNSGIYQGKPYSGRYNSCVRLLSDCIDKKSKEAKKNNTDKSIKHFVENLKEGDAIITFNWDTLLETYIEEAGKRLNIGEYSDREINVLKLHGSLSWCKLSANDKPTHPELFINISEEENIVRTKDHSYFNVWDVLDKPPYIITPINAKRPMEGQFQRLLWKEAFYALLEAEKIIIIGYSLPAIDLHARALLLGGVRSREILLIDPDPTVRSKYSSAITPSVEHIVEPLSNIDESKYLSKISSGGHEADLV